ncbi:MAG: hypothetical protein LLG01_04895 [Planctomycetaceae bacterium]|nr:hypothetical protein [Planctomycetaceae bacterium]
MNTHPLPMIRCLWPRQTMLLTLAGGLIIGSVLLPSLHPDSIYSLWLFSAILLLCLARWGLAILRREQSRMWILYAMIQLFSSFLTIGIMVLAQWIKDMIR